MFLRIKERNEDYSRFEANGSLGANSRCVLVKLSGHLISLSSFLSLSLIISLSVTLTAVSFDWMNTASVELAENLLAVQNTNANLITEDGRG